MIRSTLIPLRLSRSAKSLLRGPSNNSRCHNSSYRGQEVGKKGEGKDFNYIVPPLVFGLMYLGDPSRFRMKQTHAKALDKKVNNFIADVVGKTESAVVTIEVVVRGLFSTTVLSNGSGFLIRDDGLIVTSAHVVLAGKLNGSLNVRLHDNTSYTGTIEAMDMKSDLAILRINGDKKFPVIHMSSDVLRPGEWVVAMGSPLALQNTITAGVVSTVHRRSEELKLTGKDMGYIQTDASLTFGNSGGPLVNLDGEAIGVNAMKVAPGISFAVPIEYVRTLLYQMNDGKLMVSNPPRFMGVSMLTLTPQIRSVLEGTDRHLTSPGTGVLIWQVAENSPAHKAGLQRGDVVVEVNSKRVSDSDSIYKALASDSAVVLKVFRKGNYFTSNIKPSKF